MKKHFVVAAGGLLLALFIFAPVQKSVAQTKSPEVLMLFERQDNGKVAQINASNQKVFPFYIEGLITQTDVAHFNSLITKDKLVVSVKITETLANGQRKGSIVMDQNAKLPNFQAVLRNAGINTISIDGELKSVDALGKDKKTGNKKQ